jgi:hypothetical protein
MTGIVSSVQVINDIMNTLKMKEFYRIAPLFLISALAGPPLNYQFYEQQEPGLSV